MLKALSISHDYLALWITINVSDLSYLLILKLVGISFSSVINQITFKKIEDYVSTMNPIIIAQFFYIIYITFIDHLIIFGRQNGLLQSISNLYFIIKTNGRNMLHLYCILWLSENLGLVDIRT